MGWRVGEIWLDTELFWFREQAGGGHGLLALHAPSFLDLEPDLPVAVPNGLAASRWRRAELVRRRREKRTRAAAVMVGSAVILTLAAPRVGGSRGGYALAEDPPSLTFGLGLRPPEVTEAPIRGPAGHRGGRATNAGPTERTSPKVDWREATSHGLHYSGSLSGGTQLPVEGPDWVTWNPVADSVPNVPRRLYGHERTIRKLLSVIRAYRAANPDAPLVLVGDISFRGGGQMELHVSHQNGLDVDVYYPRLDRRLRAPVRSEQIDRRLAQDLLDRFVAAGAKMVFVGYSVDLRGPDDIVIPYPNHGNHMHVRFRRPGH